MLSHQVKVKSQLTTSGQTPTSSGPGLPSRHALRGMGLSAGGAGTATMPCTGHLSHWAHRWQRVIKQVGYLSFGKQSQSFGILALWWLRCFLKDVFTFFFPFWINCSEILELASSQPHLPAFNHSVDSSAKTGVIRPKIYHQERLILTT